MFSGFRNNFLKKDVLNTLSHAFPSILKGLISIINTPNPTLIPTLILTLSLPFGKCFLQGQEKIIYMIPGQGSDGRLFKNISIADHEVRILEFVPAQKGDDMQAYARRMAEKMDMSQPFSLVGVSLGGMIALEINKIYGAEEVVLIASAKGKEEIPGLYRFFNKVPLHKLLGGNFLKFWVRTLQPMFEPMSKEDQTLWRDMLKNKESLFMKSALACIIEWEHQIDTEAENIYHIHGSKDKTLPVKHIGEAILVQEGTHVMTLTKGDEIYALLNNLIQ